MVVDHSSSSYEYIRVHTSSALSALCRLSSPAKEEFGTAQFVLRRDIHQRHEHDQCVGREVGRQKLFFEKRARVGVPMLVGRVGAGCDKAEGIHLEAIGVKDMSHDR